MRLTRLLALLPTAWWVVSAPGQARADDKDRVIILEENDSLYFNSDKHHTQGARISDLRPDLAPDSRWNAPFDVLGRFAPIFSRDGSHKERKRR